MMGTSVDQVTRGFYRWARRHALHRLMPASSVSFSEGARKAEIVGYFTLVAGVGESARLCVKDLLANGDMKVRCVDVTSSVRKKTEIEWPPLDLCLDETFFEGPPDIRILHLNPPMLPPAIMAIGRSAYKASFNIAYWAWEFGVLPDEWVSALRYVNAVFVTSSFTASAVQRYTTKPVIVVPHPMDVRPLSYENTRAAVGVPPEAFMVSFIFSLGSSVARKFPNGAVAAFREAFSVANDTYLVIKTSHGNQYRAELEELRQTISASDRIIIIDEIWSAEQVSSLIAESNAYISLHRSEGFGLTIAEAILRGVPVVTTKWSGNMDYCSPTSVFLVDCDVVPVPVDNPSFSIPGATWADPNIRQAADHLRAIYSDRDAALDSARCARKYAMAYFAENTYQTALNRLATLTG